MVLQAHGEFIPQLIHEGKQPRVMLTTPAACCMGCGRWAWTTSSTVFAISPVTRRTGAPWNGWATPGPRGSPSTRRRIFDCTCAPAAAFAAIFGLERSARARILAAEMALPNHPDVAYEFVRTLKECGYRWSWCKSTPSSAWRMEGKPPAARSALLVARNSQGQTESITAIIKTRAVTPSWCQMQPYYEAKAVRAALEANRSPTLGQIADARTAVS